MADDADNVIPIKRGRGRPKGSGAGNGNGKSMSPEARANWLASVRKTNNKPGMGAGWGGPPTGPGTTIPIHEHPANAKHMTGAERAEARRTNEEIRQRAIAKIDALIDSDHEGTALQASIAALNRTEGLPVARQINADASGLEAWVLDSMGEPIKREGPG
jgi:hypothetical protein